MDLDKPFKQLVVLDDLRTRLEMLDSDIYAGSYDKPITSGIENVAANIMSKDGSTYQGCFTSFTLSPLTGRVLDLDKSFLHFIMNFNFNIKISHQNIQHNGDRKINIMVGPRDTSSIFNQLQLLIDNNIIWDTTYHRTESAISLASLPSSIVEYSPMYATTDKLLNGQNTPMQLITITQPYTADLSDTPTTTYNFNLQYDLTIDLNRLCIPLSNIHYITSNMGNLRLKCFLNDIDKCFYYMVLPDGISWQYGNAANKSGMLQHISSYVSLDPIEWGTPLNIVRSSVVADLASTTEDNHTLNTNINFINGSNNKPAEQAIILTFEKNTLINNTPKPVNFFTCQVAEICQATFDLENDSFDKLDAYFAERGVITIPINELSTAAFNIGTLTPGTNTNIPNTLIANIPGNNIIKLIVCDVLQENQTAIINPYISNFQILLDGKPLNVLPYTKIDNRAITDFTQAMLDTDTEEINKDYLYSLSWPPRHFNGSSETYKTSPEIDETAYNYEGLFDFVNGFQNARYGGYKNFFIKNTPLCPLVFDTAVPESFMTGMCIIDNVRHSAIIQFKGVYERQDATTDYQYYGKQNVNINSKYYTFQTIPSLRTHANQFIVSALCDSVICLKYDPVLKTCKQGYKSWARPYLG